LAIATFSFIPRLASASETHSWAILTPDRDAPKEDLTEPHHVPGSAKTYTSKEIDDLSNPPDWLPADHVAAPAIVAHGGGPNVLACASCHLYSGQGHPESATLAGQPVAYLIQQMADFRSGARKDPLCMTGIGKAISDEDARIATAWFAKLTSVTWFTVVEAERAPKSIVDAHSMRVRLPGAETEPLGDRILEIPMDTARAVDRDPRSGFVTYVPPGSVAKGRELASSGVQGRSIPCVACHGDDLRGNSDIPRVAGLSALYIARQLSGFRDGARSGPSAEAMKPVTENLTNADILALSAYLASQKP
jgi:cytochrome c553